MKAAYHEPTRSGAISQRRYSHGHGSEGIDRPGQRDRHNIAARFWRRHREDIVSLLEGDALATGNKALAHNLGDGRAVVVMELDITGSDDAVELGAEGAVI